MTGMDKLVDSLCALAASWEDKATAPIEGLEGVFPPPMRELSMRNCAKELRDVLLKHKVGAWL